MIVRDATVDDMAAVNALYNATIATTTAAWTEDTEPLEARQVWFAEQRRAGYATLVADVDGAVAGFAAFGDFRDTGKWPGYRPVVELSVHVAEPHQGNGIGRALVTELIERARSAGKTEIVAAVDGANDASIRFHERLGFGVVGRMPGIGTKFGRRLDLVLLQRATSPVAHGAPVPERAILDDLFVLDLTVARAGPTAVRNLADWGARVLRIEPRDPGLALLADHDSSDYLNLHRRTQLAQLDLRGDADRATFFDLVRHADVLVENFRAPVKDTLGIGYQRVAAINPRLVYASIAGYGQDGPAHRRGAVDQIIQGVGGLMSVTGLPGQGPVRAGIAVSDSAAGNLLTIGILLALRERDRTSRGQWVRVSLLEAMISFLDFQAARWTVDGHVPASEGNHHPTARPMGTYRAADGYLNVAAPSDRLWARLCAALEAPELAADPRFASAAARYRHRAELDDVLGANFATAPRATWMACLDDAGIPNGPVYSIDEMFADPQVRHLAMLERIEHPIRGPVDVIRNPITMSRSRTVAPATSPRPGRGVADVLRDLGVATDE